jgi:hypothetical protein
MYLFSRAPRSRLEPTKLSLALVLGLSKGPQSGRTVKLTTPHIVPRLRMSGAVSLLSLYMDRAVLPYLPVIRCYAI